MGRPRRQPKARASFAEHEALWWSTTGDTSPEGWARYGSWAKEHHASELARLEAFWVNEGPPELRRPTGGGITIGWDPDGAGYVIESDGVPARERWKARLAWLAANGYPEQTARFREDPRFSEPGTRERLEAEAKMRRDRA